MVSKDESNVRLGGGGGERQKEKKWKGSGDLG